MKYNIIIKAPKAAKITLNQVYKFNRIYSEGKPNKVEVYEKNDKFYLVHKGKITVYFDQDKCFESAKKLSETSK